MLGEHERLKFRKGNRKNQIGDEQVVVKSKPDKEFTFPEQEMCERWRPEVDGKSGKIGISDENIESVETKRLTKVGWREPSSLRSDGNVS